MGHFAGGLAEGISSGSEMAMRLRQLQQDSEYRKDLLDYRQKEQKMKLDALKLAKEREEKQNKWSEQFFSMVGDTNARSAPANLQNEPTTPAPAGIGPPQQPTQQLPPRMSQLNPQQRMMAMAAAAGRGGQLPAFNAMAQQGLIQTPAVQQEMQDAALDRQAKMLTMLDTQSQMEERGRESGRKDVRLGLEQRRVGMAGERLGIEREDLGLRQRRLMLDNAKARRAEQEFRQQSQLRQIEVAQEEYKQRLALGFIAEGNEEAAMRMATGDVDGAIKARYGKKYAEMTDNELLERIRKGDQEAAEVMGFRTDLNNMKKQKEALSVSVSKEGETSVRVGPEEALALYPPKQLAADMEEIEGLRQVEEMGQKLMGLYQQMPEAVGGQGDIRAFAEGLQEMVGAFAPDKSQAMLDALKGIGQELNPDGTPKNSRSVRRIRSRMESLKSALQEAIFEKAKGTQTEQDAARLNKRLGEDFFGITIPGTGARIGIDLASARDKVEAISEFLQANKKRIVDIRQRPEKWAEKMPKRELSELEKRIHRSRQRKTRGEGGGF